MLKAPFPGLGIFGIWCWLSYFYRPIQISPRWVMWPTLCRPSSFSQGVFSWYPFLAQVTCSSCCAAILNARPRRDAYWYVIVLAKFATGTHDAVYWQEFLISSLLDKHPDLLGDWTPPPPQWASQSILSRVLLCLHMNFCLMICLLMVYLLMTFCLMTCLLLTFCLMTCLLMTCLLMACLLMTCLLIQIIQM